MRSAALVASLAAMAIAGCGGESGDLLSFEIAGGPAGTTGHTIVVTGDGRGSCDQAQEKLLPSERVIDAREIEKGVTDLARRAAEYPPKSGTRRYTLSTDDGDVKWSEGTPGLPEDLPKAQLLALQLEQILCR
jgi:hypothetical protein